MKELIRSQVNFGLAYVEEARIAYREGRRDFGDVARGIAENAHRTAVRFVNRLAQHAATALPDGVERLRAEIDHLWPDGMANSREIA